MNTPTFADVIAAADRIAGVAHRTPVLTSRAINSRLGFEAFFKAENLQRAGAFKFRGAYNTISKLTTEQRKRGIVAFSSGNHAQSVALAGSLLDAPVTIVMPMDAPAAKIAGTKEYGAEVVLYNRRTEEREEIARDIVDKTGAALVPPFNHPDVIAGQGTATLELLDEVPDLDAIFMPIGGGGLLAGACLAVQGVGPNVRVYGAEPALGNDAQQSLRNGSIVSIDVPDTIADGAQTQKVGEIPFAVFGSVVTDIVTATDDQLIAMMHLLLERMKILVEPTGTLGIAAAAAMKEELAGQRVGVILSGGNVDLTQLSEWVHTAK